MPRFNQTGPAGMGPMTGWSRGMCNTARPAYGPGVDDNAGFGRGMGFGRGFRGRFRSEMRGYQGGRLFRNQGAALQTNPVDAYPEIEALKAQAESMQNTLDALNNRITEMENN